MNRRQLLTSLLGTPVVAAGVLAVHAGREVVLIPGAVQTDLHVYDSGGGRMFALRLLKTPWPIVGDRVRLDFQDLHLVGVVETTVATEVHHDRFVCDVTGRVLEFHALGITG